MKTWLLKCLILCIVEMVMFCRSSSAISLKFESSALWSGICHVQLAGDYAYCAATYGLLILDVQNPGNITIVSQTDFPSGGGRRLRVEFPYVYFADGYDGLRVLDISNPALPISGGSVGFADEAMDVRVTDGLAYLAAWGDGLQIVDVSSPMTPVSIGSHAGHAQGMQVADGIVYMASHHYGIILYDATDPENPVELGTQMTSGFGMGIDLRDTIAYMADFANFTTFSISNTSQPYILASVPSGATAFDVELKWPYAYLAVGDSGLSVYDVNSSIPQLVGRLDTPGIAAGIDVDGNRCAISFISGIELMDISSPTLPVRLGRYELGGSVLAAAALDNSTLAVAHGSGGLRVLKLGGNGRYNLAATDSSGDALDVEVKGNYAFVCGSGSFRVVSLSNQQQPMVSFETQLPDNSTDLDLSENLVALALEDSGVAIFGIENIAVPQFKSRIAITEPVSRVAIDGNRLAVVTTIQKTYLFDLSNPISPVEKAIINTPQPAAAGEFRDGVLFLACGSAGVIAYDVANMQSPYEAGMLDTPSIASGVSAVGNYLFVADADAGVHLVNAANPANMSIVDTYNTLGKVVNAVQGGGNILVSDQIGLIVLGFDNTLCGDADLSGIVTISDAVFLINYIFAGGPEPLSASSFDADCNGIVTISDAVYLINYIFAGGPSPCSGCSP